MRVAFIHSGYSRHLQSGIIRVETELVAALRQRGHVAEIMPWPEDQSGALVQQQYLRIARPAALVFRAVRDFITAGQYDVVVFMGVGYPETRALPWLKRETRARFMIIQNGWATYNPATRFLITGYMQTTGHLLLAEADAVVAVSNYVKSHLATYMDPDRIHVVYPGVDTSRFAPIDRSSVLHTTHPTPQQAELRDQFGIREPRVLIANGKLAAHKNIATIIRALPLIPDTALMLVGSGTQTKVGFYQELAASLGVAHRTHFIGTVANEKLPPLYRLADICVHAARSEALGIALLEALSCGVPVVAPDVGGISEAVVHRFNGLLYDDPRDHAALARQITTLLDNDTLRLEYGARGRAYVQARFDWKVIVPHYLRLFAQVAKPRHAAEPQPSDGVFGAFA